MPDVAAMYGFPPNRANFIKCPFHEDSTASLKIYPGDGGWHCFGCGEGGDVIDFVARLLRLRFSEAVARIDTDFGLGLAGKPQNDTALRELRRRQAEARQRAEKAAQEAREFTARLWALRATPPPQSHAEAALYGQKMTELAYMEYLIEEGYGGGR